MATGTAPRIGNLGAIALIAFAFLFDATQIVLTAIGVAIGIGIIVTPIASVVVALFAYVSLFLVLKLAFRNIKFFGGKKAALKILSLFSSIGVELVPFLQVVPGILSFTLAIIIATRLEDTFGGEREVTTFLKHRDERTAVLARTQAQRLEEARRRDEEKKGGASAQDNASRENERENRREERSLARENFGIATRAVTGNTRNGRQNEPQTPGVLGDGEPVEEKLSGFEEDLDRCDRAA